MRENPKVTVLMSVYNGERYLSAAIDSILKQTFTDFEFLIINDGSSDNTPKILKNYKDARIKIINNQRNVGLTRSLNKGLHLAKGDYIARQDADDISLPERIQKQVDFMEENKNVVLLGTAISLIDEDGNIMRDIQYPISHFVIRKALKKHNCFCHGSVMFKKQYVRDLGGYREVFKTAQDYDVWLRLSEKHEVANLRDRVYQYRFNPSSVTFKKILNQLRMANFARKASYARDRGANENMLLKEVNAYLQSPVTIAEKREIIQTYKPWGQLLIKHNRTNEAFLLTSEVVRYHPSVLYKLVYKIAKRWNSSFILERLI